MEGGVEAHAQNLYPRLAQLGCDVEVVVRSPYVAKDEPALLAGRPVPPGLGPQGAGPRGRGPQPAGGARWPAPADPTSCTSTPSARPCGCRWPRLLGLKVVVTHHSLNYEHEKWGRVARTLLRFGEFAGMRYSHGRIAIARPIAELMPKRHGVYGAVHPQRRRAPRLDGASDRHRPLRPRARPLPALRRSPHAREAPARPRSTPSPRPGCTGGSWCWSAPTARTTATPPSVVEQAEAHAGCRLHRLPDRRGPAPALRPCRRVRAPVGPRGPVHRPARGHQLRAPGRRHRHPRQPGHRPEPEQLRAHGRRDRRSPSGSGRWPRKPITPHDRERRRAFVTKHFDWDEAAADTLDTYRQVLEGRPALRLVAEQAQVA